MASRAYYNENDPRAAAWLRELMKEGVIMEGEIDERSIEDVLPGDLQGFTRCHFFAGIGGWDYALQLAGWPEDRPVWTGSCPCQFKSSAARGRNVADDLWPLWRTRIGAIKPRVVFGEQIATAGGWFDGVCDDVEGMGYTVGAAILPAVSVGADHARPRIFFACHTHDQGESVVPIDGEVAQLSRPGSESRELPDSDGLPGRVGLLRGYGNAIVPQAAAAFIQAWEGSR